jgi:hypothetical protein
MVSIKVAIFARIHGVPLSSQGLRFLWARRQKEKGKAWMFEEITIDNQGEKFWGITQWHWICLGKGFQDLFFWFFYPVMALSFISILTAFPFVEGKKVALDQVEKFQDRACESNDKNISCIYLIKKEKGRDHVLAEGILISANKERIAIYNKKLEVWPLLDSYIIRQKDIYKQDEKSLPPEE